jgi:anti-anti-sigma factor
LDSPKQRFARSGAGRTRFSCRRSVVGDAVQIVVDGALDAAALSELDDALRLAWASADEIVLDLGGLESMDFGAAKLIIDADRRIRRAGGNLSVRRGASDLDWLLDFIDLDRVIDLVDRPPVNPTAAMRARNRVAAYFRSRAGQIAA